MSADWAIEAHRRLAAAGLRAGGAREALIDLLAERGGCLTAQEVIDLLRERGRRVAVASVYRNLATLREAGLLAGTDHGGGVRYELVGAPAAHHHHLVCARCGTDERFTEPLLETMMAGIAADHGARLIGHDVSLRVLCRDCAARR